MGVRAEGERGAGHDAAGSDATRRTQLANERTYLAWWRTALTAYAASIGAGKLVPDLASGPAWPYTTIGIGLAICGVVCSGYALRRHESVKRALSRGEFAEPDARVVAFLTGAAVVLGMAIVAALIAA